MSKHIITSFAVSSLALLLALQGGTPFHHPDFLLGKAKHAVLNFGDPGFFNYPALMIYLNGFVYSLYELILRILPNDISEIWRHWPYKNMPCHWLTMSFSVIAALSTYGSSYILTKSRLYASIGAFVLITSPLWNADAHFITVDVPLAALCALTLFFLLTVIEDEREIKIRDIVLLGILIGLTTSAKYNGAIVALSVVGGLLYRIKPLSRSIAYIGYCGLIAIATFLFTNPYILLDYQHFINDLYFELEHSSNGHFGYTTNAMHYHISESLRHGFGGVLLIFSAGGAIYLLANKQQSIHIKLALFAFPLFHLLILLTTKLAFQRYALPLLPFLAIFTSYTLYQIGNERRTESPFVYLGRAIVITLVVVSVWTNLSSSLRHNNLLSQIDTRSFIQPVFFENKDILVTNRIIAGDYTKRYVDFFSKLVPVGQREMANIDINDIVIFDSFSHDRYIYSTSRHLRLDLSTYASGEVLIISPYFLCKEMVPFSPKSVYSPYFPDIAFRTKAGPYIEIYFGDPSIAQRFSESFFRARVEHVSIDAQDGYYYKAFSINQPEIAQQGASPDCFSATLQSSR